MATLNAHGSITPVGQRYAESLRSVPPHFPIHLFTVTRGDTRCPCTTSGHWNQQLSGGRTYPTPQPCCDRCATKHNQPRVFPVGSICWEGDNLKGRHMMFCFGGPLPVYAAVVLASPHLRKVCCNGAICGASSVFSRIDA